MIVYAIVLVYFASTCEGFFTEFDCSKCEYDLLGVGYIPHSYCQAYIHCNPIEGGEVEEIVRCCADGFVWDQDFLTCLPGSTGPYCSEFPGDFVCPEIEGHEDGDCPFTTIDGDVTKFKAFGNNVVSCPPATMFNQVSCTCVHDGSIHAPCHRPIHFRFDDGHYESHSCNNVVHGTVHSSPTFSDGALCFDGIDDFIDFEYFNNYFANNPAAASLSIAAWIKPVDNGMDVIKSVVTNGDCKQGMSYYLGHYDRQPLSGMITDQDQMVTLASNNEDLMFPEFDTWNHVATVYTGESMTLYLNGNSLATISGIGNILNSQTTSLIGMLPMGEPTYYAGCIDDVMVYTVHLTPGEVKDLYDLGRTV